MQAIASKLCRLIEACGYIQNDGWNQKQNYSFISSAAVMKRINAEMVKLQLCSVVSYTLERCEELITKNNSKQTLVHVSCSLNIIDSESGEMVTTITLGSGADSLDKAVAKAQTMALKYAWMHTLCISTGDDPEDDGSILQPMIREEDLPDDPLEATLIRTQALWNSMGWNADGLGRYAEKRMKKPIDAFDLNDANEFYEMIKRYIEGLDGHE